MRIIHLYELVVVDVVDGLSLISKQDAQEILGCYYKGICHFCDCPHTPLWVHAHCPTFPAHIASTSHAMCKEFLVVFDSDAADLLPININGMHINI